MAEIEFNILGADGGNVHGYKWEPNLPVTPRAAVLILHGNGEHAGRYRKAAEFLNSFGYRTYASDHRGHGRTGSVKPGDLRPSKGACEGVLQDIRLVQNHIRKETDLPLFLVGYSWGFYLALRFAEEWGESLKGVVLTGVARMTPALKPLVWLTMRHLSNKIKSKGYQEPFPAMKRIIGSFEKTVADRQTRLDWLSRDKIAIQSYFNDPLCTPLHTSCGFSLEVLQLYCQMMNRQNLGKLPAGLPFYLFSGSADPAGGAKAINGLVKDLRKTGVQSIESTVYKDARHNLFHEINRGEVLENLLLWMNGQLAL